MMLAVCPSIVVLQVIHDVKPVIGGPDNRLHVRTFVFLIGVLAALVSVLPLSSQRPAFLFNQ